MQHFLVVVLRIDVDSQNWSKDLLRRHTFLLNDAFQTKFITKLLKAQNELNQYYLIKICKIISPWASAKYYLYLIMSELCQSLMHRVLFDLLCQCEFVGDPNRAKHTNSLSENQYKGLSLSQSNLKLYHVVDRKSFRIILL